MSEATKARKRREPAVASLPPSCDALLSRVQVCAALGGLSMRTFQRMVSTGEFPPADTRIGSLPRWRAATVNGWIESRCRPRE